MAKILVVDDDPDILVLIEQMLLEAGHEVVACLEPHDVVRRLREELPDAAILDVMMPELSGFDVLKELRKDPAGHDLPVLFLSALDDSEARVRGLREGADDYLGKPFDLEELLLRINRLVDRRKSTAERPPARPQLERQLSVSGERLLGEVRLGRYAAHEVVGRGAMGLVFRGWDPRLKRPVALKTLRIDKLVDSADVVAKIDQLVNEAVLVARFNHPNIVAVYDVEVEPELAFMAMEYVDGPSLVAYLRQNGPLTAPETVHVGLAVARALEAAHAEGVVHHDVKPGNVLLGRDGSIKVTDFGIARLGHTLAQEAAKVFGTLGYLAPEALRGEGYGPPSDLFALGAVLYECLTGKRAFGGRTIEARVENTLRGRCTPLRELAPRVPRALDRLVTKLLSTEPKKRPRSAADAVRRLTELADPQDAWRPRLESVEAAPVPDTDAPHSSLFSPAPRKP